jgi:hypothetical protein
MMAASYADDICPSLAYSLLSVLAAMAGIETVGKVVLPTNASLPLYHQLTWKFTFGVIWPQQFM